MRGSNTVQEERTRRRCLKYGGALATGGLLAGEGATPTGTESDTVEMAPMGEVAFDAVSEDVFTILGHDVDMTLALGDTRNAAHAPDSLFHRERVADIIT